MAAKKTAPQSKKTTDKAKAAQAASKAEAAQTGAEKAEAKATRLLRKTEELAVAKPVSKHARGFVSFLREQSVVGLAIGLVLGTQAKVLVDQLIASFVNPIVGLLLPGEGTLKEKTFSFTLNGKTEDFGWGAFVISLMTFVIVAAVVYFVFKGLQLDRLDKKKEG